MNIRICSQVGRGKPGDVDVEWFKRTDIPHRANADAPVQRAWALILKFGVRSQIFLQER